MSKRIKALILGTSLLISSSWAAIDTFEFADKQQSERFRTLTEELRCPKCQNQNIADSESPIALDMRAEIYQMLQEGKTNQEIEEFLVDRFGEFVRYRPPVTNSTLLLWYGPAALLGAGFVILGVILYRRKRASIKQTQANAAELNSQEQQQLEALLRQQSQNKSES